MPANDHTRPDPSTALSNWSVLVTRPRAQAGNLCQMIENAGGQAVRFPVIEILPGTEQQLNSQLIAALDQYDIAIFVSRNAVRYTLELLPAQFSRPPGLQIAAIGRATASMLEQSGWHVDLVPESTFNSEALLSMPWLQDVSNKKIIIFKGEGGRELLADTLVNRGAQVVFANVYRRALPEIDVKAAVQPWLQAARRALIVTSQEGLDNLVTLIGAEGRQHLEETPLVVISDRMVDKARTLGMCGPLVIARQASDEAILQALIELSRQAQGRAEHE